MDDVNVKEAAALYADRQRSYSPRHLADAFESGAEWQAKRDAEQPAPAVECQRPHWDGDYLLARIETHKKRIAELEAALSAKGGEVTT